MRQTAIVTGGMALCVTALLGAAVPDITVVDAAMAGNRDVVRMLLFAGANPKATTRLGGYSPLLLASRAGNTAVMAVLVGAGSDAETVNATTLNGTTALMFAAANGRADVIRLLMAKGGDAAATTRVIDLSAFAKEELERFAQFQRQSGRGPQPAQGRGGRGRGEGTPGIDRQYAYPELVAYQGGLAALHMAARQGSVESVEALLDGGADINQRSAGDRITPIIIATLNGHFDLAKMLLEKGADPNLAEDNGVTPLYAAINCVWA